MKTIKFNQIENIKHKLTNKFLKSRKNWDQYKTTEDIDFIIDKNGFMHVFIKDSSGYWIYDDWYAIEK